MIGKFLRREFAKLAGFPVLGSVGKGANGRSVSSYERQTE